MVMFYIVLIICLSNPLMAFVRSENSTQFNVISYGAIGDGEADDTEAFREAWTSMCSAAVNHSTMLIPRCKIFLVNPTSFKGPCRSRYINVQIEGTVLAPEDPDLWNGTDPSLWIEFNNLNGLQVSGIADSTFHIDGRGYKWWNQSCKLNPQKGCTKVAPTAIKFINCQNSVMRDLSITNSPQTHILIQNCRRVRLENLMIKAPGYSPNTDGIHIHSSQLVVIQNSSIASGDDCISIGDRVSDIDISHISCGPGHGISVGSLGKGGSSASVERIRASFVSLHGTSNGARIKTWQGAGGYARLISFEYFNFNNVKNPIIIDQYYCDVRGKCPEQSGAVKIRDVRYIHMHGTSATPIAITLNCSQSVNCSNLHFDSISIVSSNQRADARAQCINAYGDTAGFITPSLSCLQNNATESISLLQDA